MAKTTTNTTKTETKKTATKTAEKVEVANNTEAYEALEKKLAEQEERYNELMKKMEAMLSASAEASVEKSKSNNKKQIKFINMTAGGFTIKGSRFYHLEKQFDSKTFSESEARLIVNNMPQSIASGILYVVADEEFMDECSLLGAYENILDARTLKEIFDKNANDVCDIYNHATDEQKQIILDMISQRRLNGVEIDANILMKLGSLSGRNLMGIEPLDEDE